MAKRLTMITKVMWILVIQMEVSFLALLCGAGTMDELRPGQYQSEERTPVASVIMTLPERSQLANLAPRCHNSMS